MFANGCAICRTLLFESSVWKVKLFRMKNSKLVELLSSLDYRERSRLRKFVISPYFNENEEVARLLSVLVTGFDGTRELLWEEMYPGEPYDDLRLRHLMSDLMRLLERFLGIVEIEKRPGIMQAGLMRSLRKRGSTRLYDFVWRKYQRKSQSSLMGSEVFLERYLLQAEHNSYLENTANRSGVTNLQHAVNDLDIFYLFNKLKYSCTILNNRKVVDIDFENALLDDILQHLEQASFADQPAIAIYFEIYRMLTDPTNLAPYYSLKALVEAHSKSFEHGEARDIYAFALNYCIGKINQGRNEFLREIFEWYSQGLEEEILMEKGRLSPWDYKNIVVVGLRLDETVWVEKFIFGYRDLIPHEHRENAFTYNLAKLYFSRHEYGEVLKLLQKVEYEDVFYNLDSKVMQLKIYYELEEFEALDSLIDSFRTFLRRNRLISDHHRTNYLNLIRFVKKLSRLRPRDKKRLDALQKEIAATHQLADTKWLKEKVASIAP